MEICNHICNICYKSSLGQHFQKLILSHLFFKIFLNCSCLKLFLRQFLHLYQFFSTWCITTTMMPESVKINASIIIKWLNVCVLMNTLCYLHIVILDIQMKHFKLPFFKIIFFQVLFFKLVFMLSIVSKLLFCIDFFICVLEYKILNNFRLYGTFLHKKEV